MADTTPKVWDNGTAPHSSLAEALAAFQAELPKLVKDETANVTGKNKEGGTVKYKYGYADLAQVCETVLPVLGKHGLSVTSRTVFVEGRMVLEVALLHESGEDRIGYWPLPDYGKFGPQDIGSAMTYGRRYLTLALTGTFPGGEDDDGEQAQATHRENWDNAKAQRPAEKPVSAPPAPEKDWSKATDAEIGDLHKRIETLPIGQAVNGYDWMAGKGLHNRSVPLAVGDETFAVTATEVLASRLADEAVKPDVTLQQIADLRAYADARGLLKVAVSESTTLDEELAMARDTRVRDDVAQAKADTPDPQSA